MITSQIIGVGNSDGVILTKEMKARLKTSRGDKVYFTETPNGYTMSAYNPKIAAQIEAAEEIMKKYKDALRALSKK